MSEIFAKLYGFLAREIPCLIVRHIIVILLSILCLLPVWLFKCFPSQDGPEHLHNAYVLKDYHNPESQTLREHYYLKIRPFPNWGSQGLLFLLMHIFPPLLAEKINLTLIIGLFIISIFYLLRSVEQKQSIFAWAAFIFCHHYLLYMGFYGFSLSISFCFFTLGYGWKHKQKLSFTNITVLYLLFAATYFCHIVSFAMLVLFWVIIGIALVKQPWAAIKFVAAMVPAYAVIFVYLLTSAKGATRGYWDWHQRWDYFTRIGSIIYFTDAHRVVTVGWWLVFGAAFLLTIWYDKIKPEKLLAAKDVFLLTSLAATGLYFVLPCNIDTGGWINDRVNLYIFLILLPWITVDYHKYIRRGLAVCLVLLSLIHIGITLRSCYLANLDLKYLTSGMPYVKPHSTVSFRWNNNLSIGYHSGTLKYATPFIHAGGYYCMSDDRVHMENYQAQEKLTYFPVKFHYTRPGFDWDLEINDADYIVVWDVNDKNYLNYEFIEKTFQRVTPPGIIPVLQRTAPTEPLPGWTFFEGWWEAQEDGIVQLLPSGAPKIVWDEVSLDDGIVECDVMVPDRIGDNAQLILRVNDAKMGTNALFCYEININARHNHMCLGKHENNWTHIHTTQIEIQPCQWHYVKVELNGDHIRIFVNNSSQPQIDYTDPNPLRRGSVGLRAWNSRAAFRRLRVTSGGSTWEENFTQDSSDTFSKCEDVFGLITPGETRGSRSQVSRESRFAN